MPKAVLLAGVAMLLAPLPAAAQVAAAPAPQDPPATADAGQSPAETATVAPEGSTTRDVVVRGQRLDAARSTIQPALGATSYTISNATIQALPQGDNQQLNQIILQLPGVVQDGFGQFHVRDDHNNLQYRINGTILPEGIAVFGQTLSPRLIDRFSLLTGALPAQYGLRTAGIIDITTKSGLFNNGGTVSLYGGSFQTIEPSIEYGGHSGDTNYFVSGDYHRTSRGIEGVDASVIPLHDRSDQYQAFAYVDHTLSDDDRVSFVGGYSNQFFQIPNPKGLQPDGTYAVGGVTAYPSERLNERQVEQTAFGQLALLHKDGDLTVQASLAARYSALRYRPDRLGELLYNGLAQAADKKDFALYGQADAAYELGGSNTIRAGVVIARDRSSTRTSTAVFPVDADGDQAGQPITIADIGARTEWTESVYLQDELKLSSALTFNFGGRFDHYSAYRTESGFSPRANLVFQQGGTTLHAGYARYFSPPPFELVATTSIGLFNGTSGAANTDANGAIVNDTPYAETQDYFDVGAQQKIGPVTIGIDAYYRHSHRLIDEGQFGAPIILTPFNYDHGNITGVEASISYAAHGLLAYANLARAKAQGEFIVSSQFNFDPADLAYIRNHFIYLDHDQTYTASGGVSYAFHGGLTGLKLGADVLYGSGLRTDGDVPNGGKLPPYAQVNLSASYRLAEPGLSLRLDVVNAGDHVYQIRDGSGIGVGAPQYGPRRGFFVGVTKDI
ncbi:TonB-dependent receptor [Sphingomonas sp.]|uniref:TonB-dependent receptor n=1 Tax=Sphingomonas sp. TaxID=28214 RepID=UPI003CC5BFC3